jgi:mutual gliding-motility protein MglA
MVFFNYSTMQMAAKVVYYGPGLCGKTTNLHYIYKHTAGDSRGEMVSLETETDRTLFFDLLPIDVGTIAGFSTRIQLYTVPGQVFYNTTRKLVLKGVDGVVFVADSQRAMVQANQDSFRNLEENLAEMGLSSDSLPLVLQYNKRDLPDILSVDEMNAALNRNGWLHFESSAVAGHGVFETLKGISKLTLLSLKKRLARPGDSPAPAPRPAPKPLSATPQMPAMPMSPTSAPTPPTAASIAPPEPIRAAALGPEPLPPRISAPEPAPIPRPAPTPVAAKPAAAPSAGTTKRSAVDVLGELEKIRKEAMKSQTGGGSTTARPVTAAGRPASPVAPSPPPAALASRNGRGELSRSIEMTLKKSDYQRARRFLVSFEVQDDQHQIVEAVRNLEVDLRDAAGFEKLLLHLNIALNAKE